MKLNILTYGTLQYISDEKINYCMYSVINCMDDRAHFQYGQVFQITLVFK